MNLQFFNLSLIQIKVYLEIATQLATFSGCFIIKQHVRTCLQFLVERCRYIQVSLPYLTCFLPLLFPVFYAETRWKRDSGRCCSEGFCYRSLLKFHGLNLPVFHDCCPKTYLTTVDFRGTLFSCKHGDILTVRGDIFKSFHSLVTKLLQRELHFQILLCRIYIENFSEIQILLLQKLIYIEINKLNFALINQKNYLLYFSSGQSQHLEMRGQDETRSRRN